jgi:tagatose-1,6-bisphosphate aldolase
MDATEHYKKLVLEKKRALNNETAKDIPNNFEAIKKTDEIQKEKIEGTTGKILDEDEIKKIAKKNYIKSFIDKCDQEDIDYILELLEKTP